MVAYFLPIVLEWFGSQLLSLFFGGDMQEMSLNLLENDSFSAALSESDSEEVPETKGIC